MAGHNISPYDECAIRKDELIAAASKFLKEGHQITEDNEGAIADFIAQGRAALTATEKARVAEREPHLTANQAIQDKYATISDPLKKAVDAIKKKLGTFLQAKQEKIDEAKRLEREEADRLRREAEEKAAAAPEHDFGAQIEAEEATKIAVAAEKIADKAPVNAGAKGQFGQTVSASVRYVGTITNFGACLQHYRDEPNVRAALESCIRRDVNAKVKIHNIPGVTVGTVHSAK